MRWGWAVQGRPRRGGRTRGMEWTWTLVARAACGLLQGAGCGHLMGRNGARCRLLVAERPVALPLGRPRSSRVVAIGRLPCQARPAPDGPIPAGQSVWVGQARRASRAGKGCLTWVFSPI